MDKPVQNIDTMKDHDVLVTLVANVENIKIGQEKFHIEMKDAFKDLKDNSVDRISKLENESFYIKGTLALIGIVASLVIYIYFTGQDIQNKQLDSLIIQVQDHISGK